MSTARRVFLRQFIKMFRSLEVGKILVGQSAITPPWGLAQDPMGLSLCQDADARHLDDRDQRVSSFLARLETWSGVRLGMPQRNLREGAL